MRKEAAKWTITTLPDVISWNDVKISKIVTNFGNSLARASHFHCECPRVLARAMWSLASVWMDNGKTRLTTFSTSRNTAPANSMKLHPGSLTNPKGKSWIKLHTVGRCGGVVFLRTVGLAREWKGSVPKLSRSMVQKPVSPKNTVMFNKTT